MTTRVARYATTYVGNQYHPEHIRSTQCKLREGVSLDGRRDASLSLRSGLRLTRSAGQWCAQCDRAVPSLDGEFAVTHDGQAIYIDSALAWNDIDMDFGTPIGTCEFGIWIAKGNMQAGHFFVL